MVRVLVTGSDGMLGSHVVRELLKRGVAVRALIEPGRTAATLEGLAVDKHYGDVTDAGQVRVALDGCDAVIHTAASTQIWPARDARVWRINYDAVRMLAEAVLESGVPSFVHVGTATSFSPGPKEQPGTEEGPYTDGKYRMDYQDSKYAAQQMLLKLHREQGLPVKIINPTFMFGAYDSKPGAGQMVLSVYSGLTPGYTSGGKSFVPARDVAVAAVHALERGRYGECYITSGENLDFREAFELIADVLGVQPPRRRIPDFLVNVVGIFGSVVSAVSRKPPVLSYPMARLSHADSYYSNRKAVEELDMPRSDLRDAVRECFTWLEDNGYVRGR